MSWLEGWQYRKNHIIWPAIGAETNYKNKIRVHYGEGVDIGKDVYLGSKCRTDFGDIRFTDNDEVTELDYFIQKKTNNDNAIFMVEVADDLSSPKEDFTTYTEIDPNNHISKTANHIDFEAHRNEDAYLYKDMSTNYFNSFKHKIDIKLIGTPDDNGYAAIWLVSNAVDDFNGQRTAENRYCGVGFLRSAGSSKIRLEFWNGTTLLNDNYVCSSDTWYYLAIQRDGTKIVCKIYSDANRTILLDTLSLTISDIGFRYIYGCCTNNWGEEGQVAIIDVENLNLCEYGIKNLTQEIIATKEEEPNWYGRSSLIKLSNGVWIATYRQGASHGVDTDAVIHIRFSDDEGETWTDEDKTLAGANVVGFPYSPTYDPSEAMIIECPNGDLLLHTWDRDNEPGDITHGTRQLRSTDNGLTWGDDHKIDYGGVANDDEWLSTQDYFIKNSVIYIGIWEMPSGGILQGTSYLAKSTDNGATWSKVSKISTVDTTQTNEVGIECFNNTIIAVMRGVDEEHAYMRKSLDLGLNWESMIDITDQTEGNIIRPRIYATGDENELIIVGGIEPASGKRTPAVWFSTDNGNTWTIPYLLDAYPNNPQDADYGDVLRRNNGVYVVHNYFGTSAKSDVKQYTFERADAVTIYIYYGKDDAITTSNGLNTFELFDHFEGGSLDAEKWDFSGAIVVSNSEVSLDNDDAILSKTKFGFGYAFCACSKADEQDVDFIAILETLANLNNRMGLYNSDSDYPDIFDAFYEMGAKDGAGSIHLSEGWEDFRNTYHIYEIIRINVDKVIFLQDEYSYAADFSNTPTVDLGACLRVWNSSQESTLTVDWIYVRKFVDPEPSHGTWGDEEEEGIGERTEFVRVASDMTKQVDLTSGITRQVDLSSKIDLEEIT